MHVYILIRPNPRQGDHMTWVNANWGLAGSGNMVTTWIKGGQRVSVAFSTVVVRTWRAAAFAVVVTGGVGVLLVLCWFFFGSLLRYWLSYGEYFWTLMSFLWFWWVICRGTSMLLQLHKSIVQIALKGLFPFL